MSYDDNFGAIFWGHSGATKEFQFDRLDGISSHRAFFV